MRQMLVHVIVLMGMVMNIFALSLQERDALCVEGNGSECLKLGIAYEDADGVEQNNTKASIYYKEGCDNNNTLSCMGLGIRYLTGRGVDINETMAVNYMTKACDVDLRTCAILGSLYAHGKGVKRDINRSITLFEKACGAGEDMGCSSLAKAYKNGNGVNIDNDKVNYYNDKACTFGDKDACFNLGNTYINGRYGVSQNYEKAIEYYKKSCHKKSAKGCSNVGALYERGLGVKKDVEQVKHYYTLSCNHGYMSACSNLGILYEQGTGVKKDFIKAEKFYDIACKGDDAEGCYNFAMLYETGKGLKKDYKKSLIAYKKSCDSNYVKACNNLAFMYSQGKGITVDCDKAKILWKKACEGGNAISCKNYQKMLTLSQSKISKEAVDRYIQSIQTMLNNKKSPKLISYKIYDGYVLFMDNKHAFFSYNDKILSLFAQNNWQIKSLITIMNHSYTSLNIESFDNVFEQLSNVMSIDAEENEQLERLISDLPYIYLDYMNKKFENILMSDINTSDIILYDMDGNEVQSKKTSREYLVSEYYKKMSEFYDEELEYEELSLHYAKKAIDTCDLNPDALFHYAYLSDDSKLGIELLEKVIHITKKSDALLNRDTYSLYNNLGYAIWDSKKVNAYDKALKYLQKAYDESDEEGLNSLGTIAYIYIAKNNLKKAYAILKEPLYEFFHTSDDVLEEKDNGYWYFIRAAMYTAYTLKDYNSTNFMCEKYLAFKDKEYEDCLTMMREIEALPVNAERIGTLNYW